MLVKRLKMPVEKSLLVTKTVQLFIQKDFDF